MCDIFIASQELAWHERDVRLKAHAEKCEANYGKGSNLMALHREGSAQHQGEE